ncbi:MAG: hypothetical protein HZA35_00605 [Parcubacteria group bacterium]|nr:hypothetical protein [Parcubacteria group bacterium]
MKKIIFGIFLSVVAVVIPTFFAYSYLKGFPFFWNTQSVWSVVLALCWVLVAAGYYHQGWLVHKEHTSKDVSLILPCTVFIVQCILFVKGIHYQDWSLVFGALIVNSGVLFSIYNIAKTKKFF